MLKSKAQRGFGPTSQRHKLIDFAGLNRWLICLKSEQATVRNIVSTFNLKAPWALTNGRCIAQLCLNRNYPSIKNSDVPNYLVKEFYLPRDALISWTMDTKRSLRARVCVATYLVGWFSSITPHSFPPPTWPETAHGLDPRLAESWPRPHRSFATTFQFLRLQQRDGSTTLPRPPWGLPCTG